MAILILMCLLLLSSIFLVWLFLCKKKKTELESINELYNHFLTYKEKYTYLKLHKSDTNARIRLLFSNKRKTLFCEKELYKKRDFLITLSKFIDLKINKNSTKYRAKNNLILVDQIASVVASEINKSDRCTLFSKFKKINLQYNLKQKELKIFKILLGQKLLICIETLENEIKQISKIIIKSKNASRVKKYDKQILYSAELYSIYNFNPNSSKILANFNINHTKNAENLFCELLNSELKFKVILAYLTSMFS